MVKTTLGFVDDSSARSMRRTTAFESADNRMTGLPAVFVPARWGGGTDDTGCGMAIGGSRSLARLAEAEGEVSADGTNCQTAPAPPRVMVRAASRAMVVQTRARNSFMSR